MSGNMNIPRSRPLLHEDYSLRSRQRISARRRQLMLNEQQDDLNDR